jgi:hypothetical protein
MSTVFIRGEQPRGLKAFPAKEPQRAAPVAALVEVP